MRARMPSHARESSRRNKCRAEFRGVPPTLQATQLRSRVARRGFQMPRDIQTGGGVRLAIRACASLAFARIGFHFDGDHRLIIECVHAGGVIGDRLEYLVDYTICRLSGAAGDDRLHAFLPEGMTVAVEHEEIAGLGLETQFVVIGFVEQTKWKPSHVDELNLAVMTIDRAGQARIRYQQGPFFVVPHGVNDRDKLCRDSAFRQRQIDRREHLRRTGLNRSMRTENSTNQRSIDGGWRAFAAYIANRDPQARQGIRNEIIYV